MVFVCLSTLNLRDLVCCFVFFQKNEGLAQNSTLYFCFSFPKLGVLSILIWRCAILFSFQVLVFA